MDSNLVVVVVVVVVVGVGVGVVEEEEEEEEVSLVMLIIVAVDLYWSTLRSLQAVDTESGGICGIMCANVMMI